MTKIHTSAGRRDSAANGVQQPHSVVASRTPSPELPPRGRAEQVIRESRRIVLLTEGHSQSRNAKTAIQLLRYRPDDIVAVLDSEQSGASAEACWGVGGGIRFISELGEAPDADSVFIGIAPPGGALPPAWRGVIEEGLGRGLNVVSGLHSHLAAEKGLVEIAGRSGATIVDVRDNNFRRVASRPGFRPGCFRVHTVGTDCSVGKMSAAKEIELGLRRRGRDAAFLATGQTGVMISGAGITLDSVVSDFVNGAAEQLVLDHQHHDIVVVEGQGCITHPAYSGVTVGLLHGCSPHALVLCHEAGRRRVKSFEGFPTLPLPWLRRLYEEVGGAYQPCRVVGVALNCGAVTAAEADEEARQLEDELALPVCDVYRDGPDRLIDAIESARREVQPRRESASLKGASV